MAKKAEPAPAPDAKEPVPPIVLILGPDEFLVEEEAAAVIREVLPEYRKGDFSLETVNGRVDLVDRALEALAAVRQSLQQTSFFATDKVVWLRGLSFSGTDRTSKSEAVREALERFRDDLSDHLVPEGVTLLITGTAIAKNSMLFKRVKDLSSAKPAKARVIEVSGANADAAKRLVGRVLQDQGWTMGPEALTALVNRVGLDGNTLRSEVAKLFAYTAGREPSVEDVEEICTINLSGESWGLMDDFGRRDRTATLAELRKQLAMKAAPMMLITILERRVNELALLADARERGLLAPSGSAWAPNLSPEDAAAVRDLGKLDVLASPPFMRARPLAQSKTWTKAQCVKARLALMRAHENLVSVSVDPGTVLEIAIAEALA